MIAAQGSYQFERLEGRHDEARLLQERTSLRLDGFLDLLNRHLESVPSDILEVGCGQGIRTAMMARAYSAAQITGFDRSDELLASARLQKEPNLTFAAGDLYHLPYKDKSFDLVYARLVFMHLTDPVAAIDELQRVLKPGGTLLIEDADRDCMFFEPSPATFPPFWRKVQEGQRRLGGDPNIGRKLASYFKQAEFQNVVVEAQPIIGGREEIQFLVRTLLPSLNTYLAPEDRVAGAQAIADLGAMATNAEAMFYHFWFVVSGKKA